MAICLSHAGTTVYTTDDPADTMYAATVDGVVTLERSSVNETWRVRLHQLQGSHFVGIAIEPASGAIFATSHNNGIAVSEDGGANWEFRNEGLESDNLYSVVCTQVAGRNKVYIGSEPARLYISEDLGRQWTELPSLTQVPGTEEWMFPAPPHDAHLKTIDIDPRDPNTLYASVEQGGLFRSHDGGGSWEAFPPVDPDVHRVSIPSSKPDHILATTGMGTFVSKDNGGSWVNISDSDQEALGKIGYPDLMTINPADENLVFIAGAQAIPPRWQDVTASPRVARSRDGGESWELMANGLPLTGKANFEAMAHECWDGGSAVYLGNTAGEIYQTLDGGDSWQKSVEGLPSFSKSIHYILAHHDAVEMEIPDRFQ